MSALESIAGLTPRRFDVKTGLDMEVPVPAAAEEPRRIPGWLPKVALAALIPLAGAGLGLLVGYSARGIDLGLQMAVPDPLSLVLGVLLMLLLSLALHEVGHLIGGWLMGFRFMLLVIGPLKLVREGEAIQWRLNEDLSLYGGVAASVPMDSHNLTPRFAVAIAAGPLASLLCAALGLGITFLLRDVSNPLQGEALFWVLVLSLFNAGIFLATILPGKTSGFQTDGAQLLDCLRGGHDAERKQISIALTGASAGGTRPRDQNSRLMQRFLDLRTGTPQDAIANWFGYLWRLDRNEIAAAGELIDLGLTQVDGLPETFRPALQTEAAYFEAWHRRNPVRARELLSAAQGGMVEGHSRARAEAAVLFTEGHYAEAAQTARLGLTTTRRSMDLGGTKAETEWLQIIKSAAEARDPQPLFQ